MLAAADVGISMGHGIDVAMESAGVPLLKGDLNGIVRARQLSATTIANIRQSLFFAFVYNAAGVPIEAGQLYSAFGILLSPMIAGASIARRRNWDARPMRFRRCAEPFCKWLIAATVATDLTVRSSNRYLVRLARSGAIDQPLL